VVASNAGEKRRGGFADQFEQIRSLFHTAFGSLRVDPAQPVVILAAKKRKYNEDVASRGLGGEGTRSSGRSIPARRGQTLRDPAAGLGGANPFHSLYHEYTHALDAFEFYGLAAVVG